MTKNIFKYVIEYNDTLFGGMINEETKGSSFDKGNSSCYCVGAYRRQPFFMHKRPGDGRKQ